MIKTNMQESNLRKVIERKGNFTVFEYDHDMSNNPGLAMQNYYASQMNIRKRQVMIDLDDDHSAIIQRGAMQWTAGQVQSGTNVKGGW